MARLTPALTAKGTFVLRAPFVAMDGVEYWVGGVRSIEELRVSEVDPYKAYYEANGLGLAAYKADLAQDVHIVTLLSINNPPLMVPDTYIESIPATDVVPYSHLILSASLGPFPDNYDTTLLVNQVAGVVSDFIGVTPTVRISRAPLTGVITYDDHKQIQTARQASVVSRETDRAKLIRYETIMTQQLEKIQLLEQMLIDAGVVIV